MSAYNATILSDVCGQLIVGGYETEQPSVSFLRALQQKRRAGAILFRRNLPDWKAGFEASQSLRKAASWDVCPLVAIDQEGGRVVRLDAPVLRIPPMRIVAMQGDESVVFAAAYALGRQLLSIGFNVNFAPVVDVDTNPANPVIGDRSFSSDPVTVGKMAAQWVKGSQLAGVSACAKHFPGHGDTTVDSHFDLPMVSTSLERLFEVELPPFECAIRAGVDAIMTAHIIVRALNPRVPATLCGDILRGWLRQKMGFEGVIVSDDLEMKAIANEWTIEDAAVQAVEAGCDLLLVCKHETLQDRAHEALVMHAQKDTSFRRLCEQAAARCRALRVRRPIAPTTTDEVKARFGEFDALQSKLHELMNNGAGEESSKTT